MGSERETVDALLTERPELESELQSVLEVDAQTDTWTFEDVPMESGSFGELVSSGVVEKENGEYRLADAEAVRAALDRDTEAKTTSGGFGLPNVGLPAWNAEHVILLLGAFGLVATFRVLPVAAVIRDEIVLSGNDPYYYLTVVSALVEQTAGPVDLTVFSELSSQVRKGEPLLVTMLWAVSGLFGETTGTVRSVLAWYPVGAALVAAAFLYGTCLELTEDRRLGFCAVALLAVTPAHAYRTGIGFSDHHAFDYALLALVTYALVRILQRAERNDIPWPSVALLGLGVGLQTLAWEAGPLLLVPLGIFVNAHLLVGLWHDRDPVYELLPILFATGLGAAITHAAHVLVGWHTPVVTYAPFVLSLGIGALVGLSHLIRSLGGDERHFAAVEGLGVAVAVPAVGMFAPWLTRGFTEGMNRLFADREIVETASLISGEIGSLFTPLLLLGIGFLLALPYLAYVSVHAVRTDRPAWLAASCFGWYLLFLSFIQIRFTGEFSLFVALFGGIGVLSLAHWVDLTPSLTTFDQSAEAPVDQTLTLPSRRKFVSLATLGVGIGGFGSVMTVTKHSQLTTDESKYRTAQWLAAYARERGVDDSAAYVFSTWGSNRMYNYFVNGNARSYRYAQRNFADFLTATDGDSWYNELRSRTGFVVVGQIRSTDAERLPEGTLYRRLFERNGEDTGRYRLQYVDSSRTIKAFTLVQGGLLTGRGEPNSTLTVSTEVDAVNSTVQFEQQVETANNGWFSVRVPQPGAYDNGDLPMTETAIRNGTFPAPDEGPAEWGFDAGRGTVVFDTANGHHGQTVGDVSWTESDEGTVVTLGEDGWVQVAEPPVVDGPFEATVTFRTDPDIDYTEQWQRLIEYEVADGVSFRLWLRRGWLRGFLRDQSSGSVLRTERVDDAEWHTARLSWDGTTVSLFLDGERFDSAPFEADLLADRGRLAIGAGVGGRATFSGTLGGASLTGPE